MKTGRFVKQTLGLPNMLRLRAAWGFSIVPDHTTFYRVMRRIDAIVLDSVLVAVIKRLPPGRGRRGKCAVAVDATGLAPGAISTFFVHWRSGIVMRAFNGGTSED